MADRAETSLSGDTGDGVFRLPAGILDDECTRILRLVGVADVDRDALAAYREDGIPHEGRWHPCKPVHAVLCR